MTDFGRKLKHLNASELSAAVIDLIGYLNKIRENLKPTPCLPQLLGSAQLPNSEGIQLVASVLKDKQGNQGGTVVVCNENR